MKKIVIIDCGIGNRASIRNMLKKIGYNSIISNQPEHIGSADILILPGIGAFDAFMKALFAQSLIEILDKTVLHKRVPILGICLGMQILFEKSEEGCLAGLSWIPGKVISLKNLFPINTVKLPHIGWKSMCTVGDTFISEDNQYYFVHSYYCNPENDAYITGKITIDDKNVVVSVRKDNIYGVQFHPEKSHKYGLHFFESFIRHVS